MYRGVEQSGQLVWLITTRSQVQILPPQPISFNREELAFQLALLFMRPLLSWFKYLLVSVTIAT